MRLTDVTPIIHPQVDNIIALQAEIAECWESGDEYGAAWATLELEEAEAQFATDRAMLGC